MKKRVHVLGAGFAGLELRTMLSEAFGDREVKSIITQRRIAITSRPSPYATIRSTSVPVGRRAGLDL